MLQDNPRSARRPRETENSGVAANAGRASGFTDRPSARLAKAQGLGRVTGDLGGGGKCATEFSRAYKRGEISRLIVIDHGSIHHKIGWRTPVDETPYDRLLPLAFAGLSETDHPYMFLARGAVSDMLTADGAEPKVTSLLAALIPPLRLALLHKDEGVQNAALEALGQLSNTCGPALNAHLEKLVVPVHNKTKIKALAANANAAIQALDANGGAEALKIITRKIGTYRSMN